MTPYEKAVDRVQDPEWDWERNPTKAIVDASVKAAEHDAHDRRPQAKYWTSVSIELSGFAGTPPGASVTAMAEKYGIAIDSAGS